MSEMLAADAVQLYQFLSESGIDVWLDGGWAVDALLGEQTRPHGDLDIVIQQSSVSRLRDVLAGGGFGDVERDDSSAWNFVLEDSARRSVDVHVVVFDDDGNGVYGPVESGEMYPVGCLSGVGAIDGHPVGCVTASPLVLVHTGYRLRPEDIHDVSALCARFDIPLPDDYRSLIPHY
jgi:lincosamide nucleotidyltransferase A/C/D/E